MMAWGRAGDETLSEPIVTDKFTDADMRHSVSMSKSFQTELLKRS